MSCPFVLSSISKEDATLLEPTAGAGAGRGGGGGASGAPVFCSILIWEEAAVAGSLLNCLVVGGGGGVVLGLGGLRVYAPHVDFAPILRVKLVHAASVGCTVQLIVPA